MENKFLLLNLTILVFLLMVSVWDTINLTKEYLYNNRQTLVRPEYANDSYPFLRDLRLQLRIDYDQVMFPELWPASLAPDWDERLDQYEEMARNFSLDFDLDKIQSDWLNKTLSGDEKMILGKFLEDIADMDDAFVHCSISRSCDPIREREFDHLDTPLKNFSILETLEGKLWLSKGISTYDPPSISMIYSDFSPNYANIDLNVSAMISKKTTVAKFNAGFSVPPSLLDNSSSQITGSLFLQDSSIMFPRSPRFTFDPESTLTDITLSISNVAIFDKRRTTVCTDEPSLVFRPFLGDSECQIRNYFVALAENCRCIPHSYRKEYAKLSAKYSHYRLLPRCDSDAYEMCREEMTKINFQHQTCELPKCIVVKNQYSYFVEEDKETGICDVKNDTCAPIQITLMVLDNFYAYYEEQFQFTSAQFFSQLGGEWGLYTGISMISIWQLVIFLYQKYAAAQKNDRSTSLKQETEEQKESGVRSAWQIEHARPSTVKANRAATWWKHVRNEINGFMGIRTSMRGNDAGDFESTMKEIQLGLRELKELRKDLERMRLRMDTMQTAMQRHKLYCQSVIRFD